MNDRKTMKPIYFLLPLCALAAACDNNSRHTEKEPSQAYELTLDEYKTKYSAELVDGTINSDFVSKLNEVSNKYENIIIYSKGGISQEAIKAGKIVRDRKINLIIIGVCSSACAEFLLPAANTITFVEKPFVGFHGNTIADMNFVSEITGDPMQYCSSIHAYKVKTFLVSTLGRSDFWKTQYQFLGLEDKSIYERTTSTGYTCFGVKKNTRNTIWYPDSRQLKHLYGIEFKGDVCADTKACYEKRLREIGISGQSYAVGENEFMVE